MGLLDGKLCVVTGASQGIGRACAERFVAEGATVVGVALPGSGGEDVFGALDGDSRFIGADITDPDAVAGVWDDVRAAHGHVDALVNVVGISGRRFGDGPWHECTDDGFDTVMAANLRSLFMMGRGALSLMLDTGTRGSIVNTTSVLAFAPSPGLFATHAYAASKAAIIGLTRSAAAYYAPHGIRVNAIAPGLIRTPMAQRAAGDQPTLDYLRAKQPLTGDLGRPEDCAAAALWLVSDESAFVTGQVLAVDGGWSVVG